VSAVDRKRTLAGLRSAARSHDTSRERLVERVREARALRAPKDGYTEPQPVFSLREIAEAAGVSYDTVHKWTREGSRA
jgi:hypothetical protein